MDVYNELMKYPIFTIYEVDKLTGNLKTAYYQLEQLMKKGLVKKIRNTIYSPVNQKDGNINASRYQIACAITDTAYISHHSAFEYYGLTDKVLDEVYVSSETKYNHFKYDSVTYKYIASRMREGVKDEMVSSGIRITDLERTVIDSIHDYDKTGGFKELITCLEGISYLDELKLLRYLEVYNIQGLYQRVGYLLKYFQKDMKISNEFINCCKDKIGKSRRYLDNEAIEDSHYDSEWELMVPTRFL